MNPVFLIVSGVLIVVGIIFSLKVRSGDIDEEPFKIVSIALVIIGVGLAIPTMVYRQDPGEVIVLRNFGGSLAGSTDTAGLHFKNPLQSTIKYDVRSNTISFVGTAGEDYTGGQAVGPQITINDSSGTTANMDVQVQYSLKPAAAIELYTKYGTQENFVRQVVAVGTRTHSRDVAGKIDTIKILTSRGDFSAALKDALASAWEDDGIIVENVSVQEIRYPEAIQSRYSEAQAAEIDKETAKNKQEVAKIEAETKKKVAEIEAETKLIEAEGEAKANEALQKSLTEDILNIRRLESLEKIGDKGNLVVVPEGATPFVNIAK